MNSAQHMLGDGLLSDIRTRCNRLTWTLHQDGAPSHTAKNTHLRREYVTFIEPPNMCSRIARTKQWITLFGMPLNRRCTAGDDSVEQLQHVIIIAWGKLDRWIASKAGVRRSATRKCMLNHCLEWDKFVRLTLTYPTPDSCLTHLFHGRGRLVV